MGHNVRTRKRPIMKLTHKIGILFFELLGVSIAQSFDDCCPEKEVQGLGPLSGTYILVPTHPDTNFPPQCSRDTCNYVKDDHSEPEALFCFMFDQNLRTDVKCQQDSEFPPLPTSDHDLGEAPVLSLNETEGDELLRLSQAFPPPPEGEVLNICSPDYLVGSEQINTALNEGHSCHSVLLEDDIYDIYSCHEQWNQCEDRNRLASIHQYINISISTTTKDITNTSFETTTPDFTTPTNPATSTGFATATYPATSTGFATFPSWRLNWCPRRIGRNPNRLRRFPQCCFHPRTQRPRGDLWGCIS